MTFRLFFPLILMIFAFPATVCAQASPPQRYEGTVLDVIAYSGQHKLFFSALEMTGLAAELQKNESWTVLAPTDAAFARLPREKVVALFSPENIEQLRGLVGYHMQKDGMLMTDELPLGASRYTTFNGSDIVMTRDYRGVLINGMTVSRSDILARNGVIHYVDGLILPAKTQSGTVE